MSDGEIKSRDHDDGRYHRVRVPSYMIITGLGFALGVLLILIGILSAASDSPRKFSDSKLRSVLTLQPNSEIYPDWVNPPVPIYMKFYMFNVTNRDDVIGGEKPELEECGPFTFRINVKKTNISFHPNGTVSYLNKYELHFEPEKSRGSLNDTLHFLNVPLASLTVMMKNAGVNESSAGNMDEMISSVGGDKLFPEKTPYEILFGYPDPIFSMLNLFGAVDDINFGFFKDFNNSNDGLFLIHTGEKDFKNTFQISRWKGSDSLSFWGSEYANMINGTDGSFLGKYLSKNDTPYIFIPQMFRSMMLEFDDVDAVKGIETFKFRGAQNTFANKTINPDNSAFCVPSDNCYDSGVLNASPFIEGAPGFVSFPHFYNAARKYQNGVRGLSPDKDKHESFYYAEPITGAVLKSHRRLQINILVKPTTMFRELRNVPETIFPMLWLEGNAEINEEMANDLRLPIMISKHIWILSYLVLCSGFLISILSALCCYSKRNSYSKLGRVIVVTSSEDSDKNM